MHRSLRLPLLIAVAACALGAALAAGPASANEVALNLAGGWALASVVTLLGQVNTRFRGRDQAGLTDTEPGNTGGTAVYASPGVRVRAGAMAVYGYFQARLYEKVNGIQISAPNHLMFGVNYAL